MQDVNLHAEDPNKLQGRLLSKISLIKIQLTPDSGEVTMLVESQISNLHVALKSVCLYQNEH